ncbi:hypothetical protein JTB14_033668 [Gonioctena quinquepunctata]|nr:hypothetical protein JTB14_033668 [Gonioctena quinquepunctata]
MFSIIVCTVRSLNSATEWGSYVTQTGAKTYVLRQPPLSALQQTKTALVGIVAIQRIRLHNPCSETEKVFNNPWRQRYDGERCDKPELK